MLETRNNGVKVTGSQIKSFALEVANSLGLDDFSGSNGWLCGFFKRNNIILSEFNGDNDSSVKLVKIKRSLETCDASQSLENIEYDAFNDTIDRIQNETNEQEEVLVEEFLTYTAEWRNWCRLCCSKATTTSYYPNLNEVLQRLFNIDPEEYIKICDSCQTKVEEISRFMDKGKITENMFNEFEELESQNNLTDEMTLKIRSEYGFDDDNEDGDGEEEEDMIYEDIEIEEALEGADNEQSPIGQQTESDQIEEEFIYDDNNVNNDNNDEQEVEDATIIEDPYSQVMQEEFFEETIVVNTSKIDESEYDFTCHICNESFDKMFFLTNHTRESHSCLPQVACITCGKYLATWDTILSHRRKHSTEVANFECFNCGAKFVTQTGLSIHIKVKHGKNGYVEPKIETHVCEICNREFKEAQVLRNHMRVHLPEDEKYPYQCDFCDKRLANKYSLKHHVSSVHEQLKPVKCHLCPKQFANRSNLRSHLISHTTENVKCPICDQVFKNRVSLQSHKKLHKENSKNFICPECGKQFFNRNHLERHRIAHSEVRGFKCEICHVAYKWVGFNHFIQND